MPNYKPILSCLSSALLFFFIIAQMTLFSSLSDTMLHSFNISSTQLGFISGLYFFGAAASLIPLGFLLDQHHTRKLTLSIVVLLCASVLFFAVQPGLISVSLYRLFCGIGNSLAFLLCMRQAAVWFPKRLSLTISLMITIGMLGGMMQIPFSAFIAKFNWEYGLYLNAIVSVFILGLLFLWLSEKIELHHSAERQLFSLKNVWKHFNVAMRNKQNWLCAIFAGLLNLPVMVLGALWGGYYLIHVHHLNNEQASFINSMIFFGMIIASPLIGWLSDKMHSRKIPMLIGSFLSVIMSLGLFYFSHSFLELSILFFMIGFVCTTQIISFSVVTENAEVKSVSIAMGFVSIVFYLIGAVGNPLFGYLMSLHSGDQIDSLLPNLFFILSFAISFLMALFLKESFKNN